MLSVVRLERRSMVAAIVAAIAGAVAGVAAWLGSEHTHVGLIVAMALLVSAPIALRALQGRWDPFEPIQIMALGLLVLFVARPIAELALNVDPFAHLFGYTARPGFDEAMLIALVGTAALYAGYFSRFGGRLAARLRPLPTDWDGDRATRFAVGLLLLGLALVAVWAAKVGVSTVINLYKGRSKTSFTLQTTTAYYYLGPYLTIPASMILFSAWGKRRTLGTALLLAVTLSLWLLLTVRRGDRLFILALAQPLWFMWYLRRGRRPRPIVILATALVVILATNVLGALRETDTRAQVGVDRTIVAAIDRPGHELTKFITGFDSSMFTVLEIEAHRYALRAVPHYPGTTVTSLLTGWIPRTLYPNKPRSPDALLDIRLFRTIGGLNSFATSMFGSAFADYGWPMLVATSIVVGILLRALWEYFLRYPGLGMQMFFAAASPIGLILLRGSPADTLGRAVFLVVPLVACLVLCSRPPLKLTSLGWMRGSQRHSRAY